MTLSPGLAHPLDGVRPRSQRRIRRLVADLGVSEAGRLRAAPDLHGLGVEAGRAFEGGGLHHGGVGYEDLNERGSTQSRGSRSTIRMGASGNTRRMKAA